MQRGSRGADRPSSGGFDRRGVIALGGFGQGVLAVPGGLSLWNELLEKVMWLSSWRCRNRGACRRCSLRLPGFPLSNTAAEEFGDLLASLCDLLCITSGVSCSRRTLHRESQRSIAPIRNRGI